MRANGWFNEEMSFSYWLGADVAYDDFLTSIDEFRLLIRMMNFGRPIRDDNLLEAPRYFFLKRVFLFFK